MTQGDIDLLFDNWLNANFDRIQIDAVGDNSLKATIVSRGKAGTTKEELAEAKRRRDVLANKIVTGVKSNLFEDFAARIWDTALPNGVALRDAKGSDMIHAKGWFGELAKKMKPTEKVIKKFSTRQLFDLSQREKFVA